MKRIMIVMAVAVLLIGLIKMERVKRSFMVGTEDELRQRLRDKFGDRLTPERMSEIEQKVVDHARRRRTLIEAA